MVRCYGYAFCHVIGRILGTRWRHVLPCYTCLSETLDVFYIKTPRVIKLTQEGKNMSRFYKVICWDLVYRDGLNVRIVSWQNAARGLLYGLEILESKKKNNVCLKGIANNFAM